MRCGVLCDRVLCEVRRFSLVRESGAAPARQLAVNRRPLLPNGPGERVAMTCWPSLVPSPPVTRAVLWYRTARAGFRECRFAFPISSFTPPLLIPGGGGGLLRL